MNGTATLNGISQDYFAAVWERDDAEAAERMQEEHEKPYKALFEALTAENIDSFDFSSGGNLYIVSRSIRAGVKVQISVFWNRDGDLLPLSHRDINSFADFRQEIPTEGTAVHWERLERRKAA